MKLPTIFTGQQPDTRPRPLRGIQVTERMDARGFPQLMITDARRGQATTLSVVDDSGPVDSDRVRAWNQAVASTPRLRAALVCDSTTATPPVLGGIFAAETKTERKDLSELEAALLVDAPALYDAAAVAGLPARPATDSEVAARCGYLLGAAVRSVDDLAELSWEDTDRSVTVGSTPCSVFTLSCTDHASAVRAFDDVSEVMADWDVGGAVWRTRWMRPFLDPSVAGDTFGHSGGRTWATIVVTGGPLIDEMFVQALTCGTRIRLRREWGRQGVMVAAALGLGVTGYTNTAIETELER